MATLILAFANSETSRLRTLTQEYEGVTDVLRGRQAKKDFVLIADPNLNRDKMAKDIRANEADICLFLFSGHAGRDQLFLADGAGDAEGIAALLGRCPKLKLVVLNGCSTAGQVQLLLEQKVPIVIATSSPINDQKATVFSTVFFTELVKGQSIRDAFSRGLDQAKLVGKIPDIYVGDRGGLSTETRTTNDLPWGIYFNPQDEALLDTWRLPVSERQANTDEMNQDIKKALVATAKKYALSLTPNAALERLPFTINEPIRNLFAVKAQTQETNQFYDTPSWERFQMILYAYRAIINLTTFTLLAELWDNQLRNQHPLALSNPCRTSIKTTLFNDRTNDQSFSNLSLLKTLGQTWVEAGTPSFLSEIPALMTDLSKPIVEKALADLESKMANQAELKRTINSETGLRNLCQEAEKSFAYILFTFGFWVNYSLTSIKDIELLKFRHLPSSYVHRIVPLQIGYIISTSANDNQYPVSQPLDTSSIMLHRQGNWQSGGLNLSPFLIDRNALIKAPKADIHYLLSFSPQQDLFCYRKATSYSDVWPIQPEKKLLSEEDDFFDLEEKEETAESGSYHTLLKDQCASFCQFVLNQSLSEL